MQKEKIWTVAETLRWVADKFSSVGIASSQLDAQLLMAATLSCDRLSVFLRHDYPLDTDEREQLRAFVQRRLRREPMAYILGTKPFMDVDLGISPGVLVPRPETEFVVQAVSELHTNGQLPVGEVADLGTGSGAIAVGVSRQTGLQLKATDISDAALVCAQDNLERFAKAPFFVEKMDWTAGLDPDSHALITTNPPYVDPADQASLEPELAFEPEAALFAGDSGRADICHLSQAVFSVLVDGGYWVSEVGAGQRTFVDNQLRQDGWQPAEWLQDYAGHDRVFVTQKRV